MTSVLLILAMAQSGTGAPIAAAVSPEVLISYRPAQLAVSGEGFAPDCRVLIGPPGKLVPVRSRVISDSEIAVELAAGYGPSPARRQLVVVCDGGGRSDPLWLTVVAESNSTATTDPGVDPVANGSADTGSGGAPGALPRVLRLDPGTIVAGEPFTLTVVGEAFQEGATVEALANIHAGTSHQPEYRSVGFPTEFASDTVLIVDFDRGFAPSPRLRSIAVVNPDGGRSPPTYVEVTRRLP